MAKQHTRPYFETTNRQTGSTLVVGHESELKAGAEGWFANCSTHGTKSHHDTLRKARKASRTPADWCKGCAKALTEKPTEKPKPAKKAPATKAPAKKAPASKPAAKKATKAPAKKTATKPAAKKTATKPAAKKASTPKPSEKAMPEVVADEQASTAPIGELVLIHGGSTS